MSSSIQIHPIRLRKKSQDESNGRISANEYLKASPSSSSSSTNLGLIDQEFAKGNSSHFTELLVYLHHVVIDPIKFQNALERMVNKCQCLSGRRSSNNKIIHGNNGIPYSVIHIENSLLLKRPTPSIFFAKPKQFEMITIRLVIGEKQTIHQTMNSASLNDGDCYDGGNNELSISSAIGITWDHALCDVGGISLLLQQLSNDYCFHTSNTSNISNDVVCDDILFHHDRSVQQEMLNLTSAYNRSLKSPSPCSSSSSSTSTTSNCQKNSKDNVVSLEWSLTENELNNLKLFYNAKTKHKALFAELVFLLNKSYAKLQTKVIQDENTTNQNQNQNKNQNIRLNEKRQHQHFFNHFIESISFSIDKRKKCLNFPLNHLGNTTLISNTTLPLNDNEVDEEKEEEEEMIRNGVIECINNAIEDDVRCTVLLREMSDLHVTTWWHPLNPLPSSSSLPLSFGGNHRPRFLIGPNTQASAARIALHSGKPNVTILPVHNNDGLMITMRITQNLANIMKYILEDRILNDLNMNDDVRLKWMNRNKKFNNLTNMKLYMKKQQQNNVQDNQSETKPMNQNSQFHCLQTNLSLLPPKTHTFYSWFGVNHHHHHHRRLSSSSPSSSSSIVIRKRRPNSHTCYSWDQALLKENKDLLEEKFALIWLHGLGDDGDTWSQKFNSLKSHHFKCFFPKAPRRQGGQFITTSYHQKKKSTMKSMSDIKDDGGITSWFDIENIPIHQQVSKNFLCPSGLKESIVKVMSLIKSVMNSDKIPAQRIVIGGFSQGGALALEVAKKFPERLCCVIAISGWSISCQYSSLARKEIEKEEEEEEGIQCPVLFSYGSRDPQIDAKLSRLSFNELRMRKKNQDEIDDIFSEVDRNSHMPQPTEMNEVIAFIKKCSKISSPSSSFSSATSSSSFRQPIGYMSPDLIPSFMKDEHTFRFNTDTYRMYEKTCELLKRLKVGQFQESSSTTSSDLGSLEQFHMFKSMANFKHRHEFYHLVAKDKEFLQFYDEFILDVILPQLKLLVTEQWSSQSEIDESSSSSSSSSSTVFYYQRPPTIRVQGPHCAGSSLHCDQEYGHQPGELNFWMPLTDYYKTQTTIWIETLPNIQNFKPSELKYGEIKSFFGSQCHHYVPENSSNFTRVSLDFRIGIIPYYNPEVELNAKAQHSRKMVSC